MVKIIEGDLFETDAEVICHQVNCQGKMGSGIALQVKEKYPEVYKDYKCLCDDTKCKNELLGRVLGIHVETERNTKTIFNLFAQERYGYDGKCYSDYNALQKCFEQVKHFTSKNYTIAMPYLMGCNRGGGDWNIVYKMIEDTFEDYNVILYKRGE